MHSGPLKVAILYPSITSGAETVPEDLRDTLEQVDLVRTALVELGHQALEFQCTLDLSALAAWLKLHRPSACFNLVETLDGSGRLLHLVPSLLEHLGIPYTSAGSINLAITTGKVGAKEFLQGHDILTPAWCFQGEFGGQGFMPGKWFIKPVWEDGSLGIDDSSLVSVKSAAELEACIRFRERKTAVECFAEQYIDGREFNVSLLAGKNGMEVLPPAEIIFKGYPEGKPCIVGWEAKWKEDSFEYENTQRTFQFPPEDDGVLKKLHEASIAVSKAFRLRGYARIDYRLADGKPYVIEVNINPCINIPGGFVAAAKQAGLAYNEIIGRILGDI